MGNALRAPGSRANAEPLAGTRFDRRTVVALRRDDLSYRAGVIEFSKSRYLRTAIKEIKPGDQNTFGDQVRTLRTMQSNPMQACRGCCIALIPVCRVRYLFWCSRLRGLQDSDEAMVSRRGEGVVRDLEIIPAVVLREPNLCFEHCNESCLGRIRRLRPGFWRQK